MISPGMRQVYAHRLHGHPSSSTVSDPMIRVCGDSEIERNRPSLPFDSYSDLGVYGAIVTELCQRKVLSLTIKGCPVE
jgi:hypothetical protein